VFASKKRNQSTYRALAAALAAFAFLAGCELAVDFDRALIPTPQSDGGAPAVDASLDTGVTPDATVTDSGTDTGIDATVTDSGTDTGTDSGTDTGTNASDAGSDASDASDSG
jgi:hypothetical protein